MLSRRFPRPQRPGAGTSKRGDQLWDTAEVMGSVPEGATVTFRAYQVSTGSELVCTEKTLVWTSQPVALEAGPLQGGPAEGRQRQVHPRAEAGRHDHDVR